MMRLLFLNCLLALSFVAHSQPGGGGDPGPGDPVPISGIEILLGGGAVIGYRYFRKSRKSSRS